MKTIQITIAIPDGAKWQTTSGGGKVQFWRDKPRPSGSSYWVETRFGSELRGSIYTGIPCEAWRESLVNLDTEGGE
jgi:hypothetical protein